MREKIRELSLRVHITTIGLGLVAGFIYSLLITPESNYALGIHVYLLLAIAGASAAFIARVSTNLKPEKVILLTVAGILTVILSPILFNSTIIGESFFEEIMLQTFVTLFFAGHAALVGSFSASLIQQIKFKKSFQKIPGKARREKNYQYSLSE
ncbi:MAG: hypothetical protein WD059_12170 [Balneolaceae bacterium]